MYGVTYSQPCSDGLRATRPANFVQIKTSCICDIPNTNLEPTILSAELLDKVSQGVPELDHTLGRNGYLGPKIEHDME